VKLAQVETQRAELARELRAWERRQAEADAWDVEARTALEEFVVRFCLWHAFIIVP
jgi:hypothetical protein